MRGSRWLAAPAFACLFGVSAAGWAQDVAAADALFSRGLQLFEAGDLEKACPAIGESYRLDPRPGALFTLAECEARRGHVATAFTRYGDYLSLFEGLAPDKRARQQGRDRIAREQRAALGPKVPEVTLVLPPGAPRGTVVRRDDVELAEPALGVPLPVDPGEHVVTVQSPGRAAAEQRFAIALGEKKQVALALGAPVAPVGPVASPVAVAPPRAEIDWRLPAGITGIGVAAAGLVLGVLGTIEVGRVNAAVEPARAAVKPDTDVCAPAFAREHGITAACTKGQTYQLVQIIAFPAAAVFGGLGIFFLATRRPAAATVTVVPALGPGHATLDVIGRF
jgi:hypothetical protein